MGNRKLYFLNGRNAAFNLIDRMICPHIRKLVYTVKFLRVKGRHRRILHKHFISMPLDNSPAPYLVLFLHLNACRFCICLFIRAHHIKTGALYAAPRRIYRISQIARPANIRKCRNRLTACQPMRDFGSLFLTHPITQKIRTSIKQDRRIYTIVPVIIVCKPTKRGLQSADDNRGIRISFTNQPAVDGQRPIGSPSGFSAGSISVVTAFSFGNRIVRDHGIDIA